ncbi:4Fe-4S ferredoxin iron-sulfur binding domain protein [Olavius sp. associated proteobacterium Delta 1]|nr:4Fe-4S ferredoxin iron-sulfur binding domain protein [Olavius sp. associated proteobacterium Delta 1]
MRIATTRRISQTFFFIIFLWFCLVTTLGDRWWQLRGWPVNWIIELDPLVGLATLLSTRTLYAGLLWGVATIVLTIVLGRFFCGWLCPFGAIHQFVGFVANRKRSVAARIKHNRYHPAQSIKYWILSFLLTISALELAVDFLRLPATQLWFCGILILIGLTFSGIYAVRHSRVDLKKTAVIFAGFVVLWFLSSHLFKENPTSAASLQIGLLDPIALVYRSFNLIVLPLFDQTELKLSAAARLYDGTWLIAAVFLAAVLLNLVIPRFYCRFICPAGALFAVLSRFSLWRIGKISDDCAACRICEKNCEGACSPTSEIRSSECILCVNCINDCRHGLMTYQSAPSATGEIPRTNLSRRQFLTATVSGAAVIPMLRVSGSLGSNWNPAVVRPPGALPENEFLSRCIKCGQCMRICPTNVIQPAGLAGGLEGLWTPVLNFRIGTSGCQHNCIACGHLCPTAAIRPISLDERQGKGKYDGRGPITIGTAFIGRGRCLPWAMGRPCIVCQENCPVSPKAITTRTVFNPVNTGTRLLVERADPFYIELGTVDLKPNQFATGDYYCAVAPSAESRPRRIITNWERGLRVADEFAFEPPPTPGSRVEILVRLQQPYVDPRRCIGCGVCEHECPVPGKRAIRITADNESRAREHALLLKN